MNQQRLTQVILAPIVSEKSNVLAEKRNQMTFKSFGKMQPNLKLKRLLSCYSVFKLQTLLLLPLKVKLNVLSHFRVVAAMLKVLAM